MYGLAGAGFSLAGNSTMISHRGGKVPLERQIRTSILSPNYFQMPKASSVSVSKTRPGQSKPTKSNESTRPTAKSKGPLKSILKKAPAPPSVQSDDDIDIEDVEGLPSEEDEEESGDEEEDGSDESEEEEPVHLKGFSDNEDDSDSSDEDDGVRDEIQMEALPTIAKDDETVKKRLDQAKRNPVSTYLSVWGPTGSFI